MSVMEITWSQSIVFNVVTMNMEFLIKQELKIHQADTKLQQGSTVIIWF